MAETFILLEDESFLLLESDIGDPTNIHGFLLEDFDGPPIWDRIPPPVEGEWIENPIPSG